MKRIIALLLIVVLAASLFAGCGGGDPAPQQAGDGAQTAGDGGDSPGEGGGDHAGLKVGILMPSVVVARWADDAAAMVETAQALGMETEVQYADDAIDNQVMQIENMITKGYDALIICPVNAESLGEALSKAKAAGVLIISYDRFIKETEHLDYYVTFDNVKVGEVCAQYLVDRLELADGAGPYNLEIFTGDIADNNAKMTLEGGMNILSPYIDGEQLVVRSGQTTLEQTAIESWATANAQNRMDNIMSAFYTSENLDAIFSTYGGMSLGCIASLQALGYGTEAKPMPIITSQDGELAIVQAVANGTLAMSLFKDTRELAQQAISLVSAHFSGETIELDESKFYDNGVFLVPTVLLDPIPFDLDNLDKVMIEDSGYWTREDIYGA